MPKDRTGRTLPPEAFVNEGEVRDPREVDATYSPEYLKRRAEMLADRLEAAKAKRRRKKKA